MSKPPSRIPLFLGFAAVGAGGYYLYSAGGDPEEAKQKVKADAHKVNANLHGPNAERAGEQAGFEANTQIKEAVEHAKNRLSTEGKEATGAAQDGINRIDEIRKNAADKVGGNMGKLDKEVEKKAEEAKGTLKGWFGK